MRRRNIIIAIAATVALTAASATGALARGGGGMGGGHGGMGGGHASIGGGHAMSGGGIGGGRGMSGANAAAIAARRAEDRRRDLRFAETHLDEEVRVELFLLLVDLEDSESDLDRAALIKRLRRIERAVGTALAALSYVLDGEDAA